MPLARVSPGGHWRLPTVAAPTHSHWQRRLWHAKAAVLRARQLVDRVETRAWSPPAGHRRWPTCLQLRHPSRRRCGRGSCDTACMDAGSPRDRAWSVQLGDSQGVARRSPAQLLVLICRRSHMLQHRQCPVTLLCVQRCPAVAQHRSRMAVLETLTGSQQASQHGSRDEKSSGIYGEALRDKQRYVLCWPKNSQSDVGLRFCLALRSWKCSAHGTGCVTGSYTTLAPPHCVRIIWGLQEYMPAQLQPSSCCHVACRSWLAAAKSISQPPSSERKPCWRSTNDSKQLPDWQALFHH